ncbi:lipoprotein-releasing ABC transporter ATP-binding protein LolD [Brumicola nitratireducens]|jgi:lipoprotein-releasing system ATP-binding protein|uniref:Lipoprotein-releasing system ATP-binding protein LolD n=1 Tax=Glaciecola nitratireducens (strain JCM 12485 / KCTC 12276 / FR1064) TaxID=1085623 RepID=G4QLG1_GLANF|nr:lipoprotein-releasing ABC transporter ATP-binding protein LolD [Glaciecola nitratireducens]AEP29828.1 inner membrane lipoproteins ABC transporter ATP-binding protein [Glaciecola nitratireducens FR1064]
MPSPLFKCENICKQYSDASNTLQILNNVNFYISAGETVAILGASGSGKSTLLHILGTLDTPDSGDVFYKEQSLFTKSKRQQALFRNAELGFVYQFHHLLPEFSAAENVAMPLFIKGDNRKKSLVRAKELLARVGLQDREQHRPHQLSGGERQRVAIARALINQPAMIFADEPTGNLDDKNTASIYDLISDINKEFKTSFLLVTHDLQLAKKMDRIMYLENGQLRLMEHN